MRIFCIAGPVKPEKNYFVPARLDQENIQKLIEQEHYFILHAPRQSGKTTAIQMFARQLNKEGKYKALYVNVEPAQAARGDFEKGMKAILNEFSQSGKQFLSQQDPLFTLVNEELTTISGSSLGKLLQAWSQASDKPIILFIDEIDSLVGDTLISVLRQLRAGYSGRPEFFPQSVCLVGVRDVRDYRIWSDKEQASILGGSTFNIKAESLTIPPFSPAQLEDLYLQHTRETGQKFTQEAIDYAYYLTEGQPWLANMLGYQACLEDPLMTKIPGTADASKIVTKEVIERAKETIIRRRDTHIDVLITRLEEPRVANIVDAILRGEQLPSNVPQDDIQYVIDLGLITRKDKFLCLANPIYQEIIPRELSCMMEEAVFEKTIWYQNPDGTLNTQKLLEKFQQFYRENADIWIKAQKNYPESAPHLIAMAFLQRVINGGGKIHREYALGRNRVDLLIEFRSQRIVIDPSRHQASPVPQDDLVNLKEQRIVIELKVYKDSTTLSKGLEQTKKYMDLSNATEGHLIIFDRRENRTWDEKIYQQKEHGISFWGM